MTRAESNKLSELEITVAKLSVIVEQQAKQLADTHAKVAAMHDVLMQAKGARWAIIATAALAGFLASKLGWVAALFTKGA